MLGLEPEPVITTLDDFPYSRFGHACEPIAVCGRRTATLAFSPQLSWQPFLACILDRQGERVGVRWCFVSHEDTGELAIVKLQARSGRCQRRSVELSPASQSWRDQR